MRILLIILITFVGLSASLLGMLLIAYPVLTAYGFSMEFIHPSFPKNFTLPGVGFLVTGGIVLTALLTVIQRSRTQYSWSFGAGTGMILWIVIHSIVLQNMPWLYLTYLICSLLMVLLSLQLKGKWAA
jgi:hypothetical protein